MNAQEYFKNHPINEFVAYVAPGNDKKSYKSSTNKYTIKCRKAGHEKTILGNSLVKDKCSVCDRLENPKPKKEKVTKQKETKENETKEPEIWTYEKLDDSDYEDLLGEPKEKKEEKEEEKKEEPKEEKVEEKVEEIEEEKKEEKVEEEKKEEEPKEEKVEEEEIIDILKKLEELKGDIRKTFGEFKEEILKKEEEVKKKEEEKKPRYQIVDEVNVINLMENTEDEYNGVKFNTIVNQKERENNDSIHIPENKVMILDDIVLINSAPSFLSSIASDFKNRTVKTNSNISLKDSDRDFLTIELNMIKLINKVFKYNFEKFEGYTLLADLKFSYKKHELSIFLFYIYALMIDEELMDEKTFLSLTKDEVIEIFHKWSDEKMKNKTATYLYTKYRQYLEYYLSEKIEDSEIRLEESNFMKFYLTNKKFAKEKQVKDFKNKYLEDDFSETDYVFNKAERVLFKEHITDIYNVKK